MSERQKMLAGEMYDPFDADLVAGRERARDLCQALNATRESHQEERRRILRDLFGRGGDSVWMQPPFFCDYGSNIELGERVFFNFNCIVLDVCRVRIGDYTLFFAKKSWVEKKRRMTVPITPEVCRVAIICESVSASSFL